MVCIEEMRGGTRRKFKIQLISVTAREKYFQGLLTEGGDEFGEEKKLERDSEDVDVEFEEVEKEVKEVGVVQHRVQEEQIWYCINMVGEKILNQLQILLNRILRGTRIPLGTVKLYYYNRRVIGKNVPSTTHKNVLQQVQVLY